MIISKMNSLKGSVTIPGDKSISHRAIMLGALAKGTTTITNFLTGADCLSTISCFQKMGITIENTNNQIHVYGKGLHGLNAPQDILDVGNSGTTTRLLSGILGGQSFRAQLNGDESIQKRPMGRIMEPLTQMGIHIQSIHNNGCAPLLIEGGRIKPIHYQSPVASAQVKSAILFAGLYGDDKTSVTEPYVSRNHSEIMLNYFGGNVTTSGTTATVTPVDELYARDIFVPGDISSAAYFIVAGLITPSSEILIKNVGINPTRDGILRVCQAMGANITLENRKEGDGEPTADVLVRTSELTGTTIGGSIIPTLIDELPIIAILACFAKGTTIIKDAGELKVKESNRIDVMVDNLTRMGAHVTATDDGMIIEGGHPLHGAIIDSKKDHRIAMSFAIAGMNADGETTIQDGDCVNISYPSFYEDLNSLNR